MSRILLFIMAGMSYQVTFAQVRSTELTHYIFPEFVDGVVLMKNGRKNEASINYNSLSEEMIFEKNGIKLAFGKAETELVDTIFMEDRKFVTLNNKFVELLYQSKSNLYAEYRCKIQAPGKSVGFGGTSETAAVDNYSTIQGNALYELELPEGYKSNPYIIYWLKKDGELKELINMRKLMNLYGEKKDLFKAYVNKHNVKFEEPQDIQGLVKYLEST